MIWACFTILYHLLQFSKLTTYQVFISFYWKFYSVHHLHCTVVRLHWHGVLKSFRLVWISTSCQQGLLFWLYGSWSRSLTCAPAKNQVALCLQVLVSLMKLVLMVSKEWLIGTYIIVIFDWSDQTWISINIQFQFTSPTPSALYFHFLETSSLFAGCLGCQCSAESVRIGASHSEDDLCANLCSLT
jgi:hypothetical protein